MTRRSAWAWALLATLQLVVGHAKASMPVQQYAASLKVVPASRLPREILTPPRHRIQQTPPSPIPVLWSLLKGSFKGVLTIPLAVTSNGVPTTIISPDPPPSDKAAEYMYGATMGVVTGDLKVATPSACPDDSSFNACCDTSPYAECLANYHVDCPGNPVPETCQKLNRALGALSSIKLLGLELGKNSFLLSKADLAQKKAPGGALLFLWPYMSNKPELKDKWLLTPIDADLLDRLLETTAGLLPAARKFRAQQPGEIGASCDANGVAFQPIQTHPVADPASFYVSVGRPTQARVPSAMEASSSYSLYVYADAQSSQLTLAHGINPPIGGANHDWLDFVDLINSKSAFSFWCGPISGTNLSNLRSLMNNSDATLFVFGLTYLRYALIDFQGHDLPN